MSNAPSQREQPDNVFYHGSALILPLGFVLKPQPKGFYNRGEWGAGNRFMNKYRPADVLPREQSVYMFKDFGDRSLAPYPENIYKVKALGPVWRSAMNHLVYGYIGSRQHYREWVSTEEFDARYHGRLLPDLSKSSYLAEMVDSARSYWAGLPAVVAPQTIWEYRTTHAEVIGVIEEDHAHSWRLDLDGRIISTSPMAAA